MIINSSKIGMSSARDFGSYDRKKKATLIAKDGELDKLEISEESKSLYEQLLEQKKELKKRQQENNQENMKNMFEDLLGKTNKVENAPEPVKSKEQMQVELLKKILEALKHGNTGKLASLSAEFQHMKSTSVSASSSFSLTAGKGEVSNKGESNGRPQQSVWKKVTVESNFHLEHESVAYASTGLVKTADGREIAFNVSFEMSRAFCETHESLTKEDYILTDPLVINYDGAVASVSDQKFLFDINADGTEDEISFLGKGSGFLALDKNNDGTINDGNELFGAKSQNGFADLAEYDEDGNGWIDEADSIFKDLKIWTKNEDGTDQLIGIGKAGVGAIYLGYADTQYSLKNQETHDTNAVIQKTGIYLKENGQVGTIQHVDMAI